VEGLEWQTLQLPFAAGLDQKAHPHAVEPPALTRAINVEFDEVGGLRMRKPYASIGTGIHPSGTIANARKLAVVNDELLLFTSDTLYAWSPALAKWVSRGTHLAVTVAEAPKFGNTNDQIFADRAQLGNVVVYVWTELQVGAVELSYVAAADATTGAVLIAPVSLGAGITRPRVVAVDTAILVLWIDAGGPTNLVAKAITPSNPSFTPASPTTVIGDCTRYDVVRDPATDRVVAAGRNTAGTAYTAARLTGALAVTTSAKARTANGVIALSCALNDRVQILRTNGTNIQGDLLVTSTLADVFTGQAVGTAAATVNQLTGAHRTVLDGGQYRCFAFWSAGETALSSAFELKSNWVDTGNTLGTQAVLLLRQGVVSRAFDFGGRVFVWSVFAGESGAAGMGMPLGIRAQLQNGYFLHRDDGLYVAKAGWTRAGGFAASSGHVAGVALVSGTTGYAWCGIERQIIITGGTDHSTYGARAPRDITFAFDDDAARRVVQLGRTGYVSGSPVLQYDGEGLTEVGFEQYPWLFGSLPVGGGALPAGAYSYKATLRWENAAGETERSTTATGEQATVGASGRVDFSIANTHVTRKSGSRRKPALEIWRTKVAPVLDSPFYLITSKDPTVSGDNGFISMDPAAGFDLTFGYDNMVDATLETREQNPENGSVLPRLAPPPATIIVAGDSRVFLAGVAGEPGRVWYSLQRSEGEVVGFNAALSFVVPASAGAITGLALVSETLIVFTINAVYAVPGVGYDNTGGGTNYGPPRLLSSDVGALSHDTIALTPGGLIFRSRKGWYRLTTGLSLEYVGAKVEDYNSDTFSGAQVVESQHQVRLLSDSRMLVWDYLVNEWSEWTESGRGLVMWGGTSILVETANVKAQQPTFSSAAYKMEIETGWIKLNGLQGFGRVRWLEVLGEYKDDHELRIVLFRDYRSTSFDDKIIEITTGSTLPVQVRHRPTQQRVESLKVAITVQQLDASALSYDAVTLTGLSLEVGLRRGLYRRLPAAQKQ
jgi:hypothetical protein